MSATGRPDTAEYLAPAKLNLYLELLAKRPDGYHELESLMVSVDLYDRLQIQTNDRGILEVASNDPTLPTGTDNLIVRAAQRLRERAGIDRGASVHVEKAIPMGAGLAGGSSDAATTLLALNRLWGLDLPQGDLDEIAATLGSDLNFFFHRPAAVCRGRGERVTPIGLKHTYHFVLVSPPFGVSTATVYGGVSVPEVPRSIEPLLEAWDRGDRIALGRQLFNRLQSAAERIAPDLCRVRDALMSLSPSLDGCLMSGSGSAYFGLARDRDAALMAARQLETLGLGRVRVVACRP